jgi:predicted Rossmann fold flavoprotein
MQQQLVVIGGGAAGFFCAINAARLNPALKVTIVEKSNKVLSKVKVSGGGRCNVTHDCIEIGELIKRYPRGQNFLKKAFHWFSTKDTIQWFSERGVALKIEADGRMFPVTNSSQTIIDCLLKEATKYGVEIKLGFDVTSIELLSEVSVEHSTSVMELKAANNKSITCNYLCIASGGYPKAIQFEWLKKIGHTIESPVPSLFTFNIPNHSITQLMGVSVEQAQIKIVGSKLSNSGPLLITHWGLSGPAVLKLSAYGARELSSTNYYFKILVNWLMQYNEQTLKDEWQHLRQQYSSNKIHNKNPFGLPNRLWTYLLASSDINENLRWADVNSKQQNQLIKNITAQEFEVKGKTTFKEEFVTCGGIKLAEVDANTMQSKIVPNIYFAGEVLDIDGITGGFNFQNAWTSGWIAAKAIAEQ